MEKGILVYALIVTIAAAITLVLSDGGTKAELPTYNIGDEWVYRSTNDITYTFHYKVTAEETIDNEDSYVIETSYDPPFLGINSGETKWMKKGTGDTMKTQMSGIYTGFLFTRTQTYSYQYSGAEKWPIEVGKEYSVTRTQTYTITPPYQTGTETKTSTVKVEKMEDVTVPAGTFTCFKEVYYDEDGNVWFTLWHSDDVKRYVKTINNETGETTELVSYSIKEESLAISGPTGLEVGEEAMFTVTSRSSPVENAFVEVDGDTKKSGADGTVTLVFDQPGNFTVTTTK
ncbi:MAG: hypothetical protein CEE41_02230 [Hadesarchaea archaeon B3_Hades]|nr:MAG: hypothetical protein CEE41_02230 [Hadesarchaea archaeon B3_Hades]